MLLFIQDHRTISTNHCGHGSLCTYGGNPLCLDFLGYSFLRPLLSQPSTPSIRLIFVPRPNLFGEGDYEITSVCPSIKLSASIGRYCGERLVYTDKCVCTDFWTCSRDTTPATKSTLDRVDSITLVWVGFQ